MAKVKTSFFCSECGYETSKWLGRCPACQAWNTLVETRKVTGSPKTTAGQAGIQGGWLKEELAQIQAQDNALDRLNAVIDLEAVETDQQMRVASGVAELDRVLGGGFVPGSLVLVGGDPGIGKSTLLLQVCQQTAFEAPLLYVCGEESPHQIKLRAQRLEVHRNGLKLLPETTFEKIAEVLLKLRPRLVIIDSIQTVYSESLSAAPGSVSQVRDCTAGFLRLAKALGITILLIGHVTKEGALAGPRILEHMVDAVLYFEGDPQNSLRIIRGVKNRFGTTNEIGVFEMTQLGLKPVPNPSEMVMAGRPEQTPGTCLTATVEGTRPLIVEIQALLVPSLIGHPQRMTQGLDRNRVSLLIAVGEKCLRAGFEQMDAYCNVVGGFKLNDHATDLALLAALLSVKSNRPLREHTLVLGEVGLTGEIRPVSQALIRVREASRLGFHRVILPAAHREAFSKQAPLNIECCFVEQLKQAVPLLFGPAQPNRGR